MSRRRQNATDCERGIKNAGMGRGELGFGNVEAEACTEIKDELTK